MSERVKNILISNGLPGMILNKSHYDFLDGCCSQTNTHQYFIGSSILSLVTKLYLVRRFPKLSAKELHIKELNVLHPFSLQKIANAMGLKPATSFYNLLGAIFLDFNEFVITDEKNHWFRDLFMSSGPGFQMVEIFVENVFETHVNWEQENNNCKERLRSLLREHFQATPFYFVHPKNDQFQTRVSIYLCLGGVSPLEMSNRSLPTLEDIKSSLFGNIQRYLEHTKGRAVILLGTHKASKFVAERVAEEMAVQNLTHFIKK